MTQLTANGASQETAEAAARCPPWISFVYIRAVYSNIRLWFILYSTTLRTDNGINRVNGAVFVSADNVYRYVLQTLVSNEDEKCRK